jgi:hypothetical protein
MKERTKRGLGSAIIALSLLGAAACGGGSGESLPAATPSGAEAAPAAKEAETAPPGPTNGSAEAPPTGNATKEEAPADPGKADTRNTSSIAALVKEHRKEARDCYENALKQIPGLKGDLVIHFTLRPNGEVKQAELNEQRSTIREASLSTCVIGVIRSIPFPKSSRGRETTVNYPFNFNP